MKTVVIAKAAAIGNTVPADVQILINGSVEDLYGSASTMPFSESMDLIKITFTDQGKLIADALWASLPGGTIDALLVEMLERKRSLFIVPF